MANTHRLDHKPFIVPPGKRIRLKDYDPAYTAGFRDKEDAAQEALLEDVSELAAAQDVLWASKEYARDHYLSGARRGRQGRHDQARHVGRQSAGRERPQLQSAHRRGAAAPFSVAADAGAAGAAA